MYYLKAFSLRYQIAIFYLAIGLAAFVNFLWTSASTYWTSRIIYGMKREHIDPSEALSRGTSRNTTAVSSFRQGMRASTGPPAYPTKQSSIGRPLEEMSQRPRADSYAVAYPKRDGSWGQRPVY